jgi:hypothetical protein
MTLTSPGKLRDALERLLMGRYLFGDLQSLRQALEGDQLTFAVGVRSMDRQCPGDAWPPNGNASRPLAGTVHT